jgi:hypothetical protein
VARSARSSLAMMRAWPKINRARRTTSGRTRFRVRRLRRRARRSRARGGGCRSVGAIQARLDHASTSSCRRADFGLLVPTASTAVWRFGRPILFRASGRGGSASLRTTGAARRTRPRRRVARSCSRRPDCRRSRSRGGAPDPSSERRR